MDFENDPKDRKRRFMRGLNRMLGLNWGSLHSEVFFEEAMSEGPYNVLQLRESLATVYGLEFTPNQLQKFVDQGMTSKQFTEIYCPIIYQERPDVDLNTLTENAMVQTEGGISALDLAKIDQAQKYGINGSEWCDVTDGPCSCGAWHK